MSWLSEQVERYSDLEPLYAAFSERLLDLLEMLIYDSGLSYWHSYSWTRSVAQFQSGLYRARREGRQLGERFDEVGDVAGVVFVTATPGDVDAIAAVVERELDIDYARSLPPAAARTENERNLSADAPAIRYEHASYVAALDENRRRLSEWRAYSELHVEVHVPTISQYAWWRLDATHLPFEWPASYPPPAREAFARVASLFAAVDDALAGEESARARVDAGYADAIAEGDLEIPLDARALAVYLRHSPPLAELVAAAEAEGMDGVEEGDPSDEVLEQELLWLLGRNGITTVAELDGFLRSSSLRAPDIFRQITSLSSERGYVPYAAAEDVITFLLVVLNRADAGTVELLQWREELEAAINTLIGNPVARSTEERGHTEGEEG